MDLAPVMDDFDPLRAENAVRALANAAPVIPLSARKALNLESWLKWLRGEIASIRAHAPSRANPIEHHHHDHNPAVA
jgi:hydrogenase nickel incorporation protein HypB